MGNIAIMKTRTPIPPTQWVSARQNMRLLFIVSKLVRILAPVVVKPLTVSNNASIKEGIAPEMKNGRAPKTLR